MKYVFLILLIVFTVKHLIDSWNDDAKKRAYTKPFLLILIILFYLFSTEEYSIPLLIALTASWLGDLLLIPKGHKWFTLGGISFMISHFFYIFAFYGSIQFSKIPWIMIILIALLYYGISLKIIFMLKKDTSKIMIATIYFYLLCNSTMNVFALMRFISHPSVGSFIAFIGALLFFISDCTVILVRYSKKPEIIFKKHFTVMLTYIVGQFLITLGIVLGNVR
ncbi:MAG: lysoplasmalogenase [Solobacterium sp.]|nr:lysoplasmalogenase [Solobacterium sp.]